MKKSLVMLSLFLFLFAGCTLTIGDGCECSGDCGKPQKIEIINKDKNTPIETDISSDTIEQY